MGLFDILIYCTMVFLAIMLGIVFVAKSRIDRNEPPFGWKRKQFLAEQKGEVSSIPKKPDDKKTQLVRGQESLRELIGIQDIRYGVLEKARNEYSVVIATDSVNFDLLNAGAQGTIVLGYQSLWKVVRFPVQLLGQAVRQDMRKEEARFHSNLSQCNPQTQDYCGKVISHIKDRSENELRITRRTYYVVSYIYQPSRMGQLTPEQKERTIMNELYMRAQTVVDMLKRARIESEILGSTQAAEVLKRAINRERMLANPISQLTEENKEKLTAYVTADATSLPGYEDLVHDVEEVRALVQEMEREAS